MVFSMSPSTPNLNIVIISFSSQLSFHFIISLWVAAATTLHWPLDQHLQEPKFYLNFLQFVFKL